MSACAQVKVPFAPQHPAIDECAEARGRLFIVCDCMLKIGLDGATWKIFFFALLNR